MGLHEKFAQANGGEGFVMRFSIAKTTHYIATALSFALILPAGAQQASSTSVDNDQLSEVVVTARRVEERLQDVPISITVFNEAQLQDRNVSTVEDLATYTPSLSAPGTFGANNATFAIRGFVQAGNTAPSVGVFFADVASSHTQGQIGGGNGAGPGLFLDLASVQVLKGPQGTLFGRNTTGGDVLLVPQKPTGDFGGYIEQSVGNYDMLRTEGVLNAPLNDSVRLRFAVDHQYREGYLNNLSPIGPRHFDDVNYTAARGSMVIDITPNLENYTILSWSTSGTNGDLPKVYGFNPALPPTVIGATTLLANIPAQIQATGSRFWDVENGSPLAREAIQQWRVINTTTWTATDALTIKNIASYSTFEEVHNENIFGESGGAGLLPIAPGTVNYLVSTAALPGEHNTAEQTVTEELQLQGHVMDGRLGYQGGVYFETNMPLHGFQRTQTSILVNCSDTLTHQCSDPVGIVSGIEGRVGNQDLSQNEYHFRDLGVYAQGNFKITDQLTLTAGARFTHDESEGLSEGVNLNFFTPNTPTYSCSFPSPAFTPGGTSAAIQSNPAVCNFRADQTSHAPTWMVDLEYKPADDVMLYIKDSRGYREGNVDVSEYGLVSWKPEKVDTYEIGAKSSFERFVRGTFDVSAFYNHFTNQQLALNAVACSASDLTSADPAIRAQCPFAPSPDSSIGNAGKSRIEGVEIDSSIAPLPGFRLDADYTYLATKLLAIDVPAAPLGFTSVNFASGAGGPLSYSPKNKVSATATYKLPLDSSLGTIALSATFTYQSSEFNAQTAPPAYQTLGSQNNLNLNLNWRDILGRPFDLSVFATNVTDKQYYLATAGVYQSFGYDVAYLNLPRMYGARLKYRFGH
jgi:iron complex outermembrane recepter protein